MRKLFLHFLQNSQKITYVTEERLFLNKFAGSKSKLTQAGIVCSFQQTFLLLKGHF